MRVEEKKRRAKCRWAIHQRSPVWRTVLDSPWKLMAPSPWQPPDSNLLNPPSLHQQQPTTDRFVALSIILLLIPPFPRRFINSRSGDLYHCLLRRCHLHLRISPPANELCQFVQSLLGNRNLKSLRNSRKQNLPENKICSSVFTQITLPP